MTGLSMITPGTGIRISNKQQNLQSKSQKRRSAYLKRDSFECKKISFHYTFTTWIQVFVRSTCQQYTSSPIFLLDVQIALFILLLQRSACGIFSGPGFLTFVRSSLQHVKPSLKSSLSRGSSFLITSAPNLWWEAIYFWDSSVDCLSSPANPCTYELLLY